MTRNLTTTHHSVYFKENNIRLTLSIKGIVSFLPNRKPTQEKCLNIGTRLDLTPLFKEWDPHNPSYGISENCMLDNDGNINSNINTPEYPTLENLAIGTCKVGVSSIMTSIYTTLEPWSLSSDLEGEFGICGVSSGDKKYPITEKELMERWRIRKEEATANVLATTQSLVKSLLEPTLYRIYKTNDRMLQYFRIQIDMFMDTYFASKKLGTSMRGFSYA